MTAIYFARLALPSLAFAVALSAVAPSAGARSRLLDDDVEVFAQEVPADNAPATRRQDERRRANDADWFRAPMQQGPQDFPAAEVRDAVEANARAATARAMFRRAESALGAAVRDAQREFEQSPELKDARAAEQRAYEALEEARREALRDVVVDPKYQAMQDLRETLSQRLAECRDGAAHTGSTRVRLVSTATAAPEVECDVVAIATLKLRVGSDARALERDALDGNEKIRQAKVDLASATAKVAELRAKFDRSLREDEELKQAREELKDARITRLTNETYLLGAREAAREALNFSYYLHRYDYYRYRPYGYGYDSYRYGYPYYGASHIHRRH